MRPARACMGEHVRQVREALAHEGDVGGLDGGVAAHGAHGDPQVGRGERRGVVDPVTHHGEVALPAQLFDDLDLALGQQLGVDFIDSGAAADRRRRALVVAGEHGDPPDAEAAKGGDDFGGLGTQLITHGDRAEKPACCARPARRCSPAPGEPRRWGRARRCR